MPYRRAPHLLICAVAIASSAPWTAGCGSDDDELLEQARESQRAARTAEPHAGGASEVAGVFDVGGRKLYLECRGTGSPTVVYLHGSVQQAGDGGRGSAARIPALLEDRHRFCSYDRANVGRSDPAPGPLTGRGSVRDLHALLAEAQVRGPFVLLGGSLGGAIADLYAEAYPDDVAGMVLLDSTVPAYLGICKRLYPPGSGPQPGQWRGEAERLDRLATFREAGTIQGHRPKIPVTYIAAKLHLEPRIATAIRRAQRAFVDRFSPGRRIVVDAPHYMEPVIPERIVQEIERVIAAGRRQR